MFFLQTCNQNRQTVRVREEIAPILEVKHVKLRGKIRVITDYNSTNYFIYKGKPMGFQYELLKELAEHLNVKLELAVNNDLTDAFDALEKGKCDLLAMNLAITKERTKRFTFSEPYSQTRQVLVQRKTNRSNMNSDLNGKPLLIRNQLDLAGKTIYVQKGSAFAERLVSLSNEIGDTINIVNNGIYEVEQFISQVAKGEIDYTIAEENVALVNQTYYPNLDVETAISFPQNVGWALRKGSFGIKEDIDKWIVEFKKSAKFKRIYRKYFRNSRSARIVNSEYFSIKSGKISEFDPIIKQKAKMFNLDWRLIASLIYQESRFDPKAESWVGAFGLMQLMPETAYLYNVDTLSTPEQNVEAGVRYIEYLNKRLVKTLKDDAADKLQFLLASYNVGLGHLLDARRLAEKNGKDPNKWAGNVDYYLLNKSKPEFYNDPVVKYGYCRGEEPFNYVNDILERYKHYQNILVN